MNQADEIQTSLCIARNALERVGFLSDEIMSSFDVTDYHDFKKIKLREHQERRLYMFSDMINYFVNDALELTFENSQEETREAN